MRLPPRFPLAALAACLLATCRSDDDDDGAAPPTSGPLVVNSLSDETAPPPGALTLRTALALAASGQKITFDAGLDGGTIVLTRVADEHTTLKGEVMGMNYDTPTGVPISYLVGYFDRDYGASALYARKNVVIDASSLPRGITISCGAGIAARVLAVYGDLTLKNVTVRGGASVSVPIPPTEWGQTATLARGAGLAVWGTARLSRCTIYGNVCNKDADTGSSRDRGAFGAGLYADLVDLKDCVVSGNDIHGSGASGAGVFSVGGAEAAGTVSLLERCAVTGNRITANSAYGAGVYSDGGGIGNAKTLELRNCTVARNVIECLSPVPYGYWRGGGIYMSNGKLVLRGCTIVENAVTGAWRIDNLGKPSLAGGVAATIGDAHAVDSMTISHCILAGNTVTRVGGATSPEDIFTGSLMHFKSGGYNRIGAVNFDQMLVPLGVWKSLCRKHYPQAGDEDGVALADVVDLAGGIAFSDVIVRAGGGPGDFVPLHYRPRGTALDCVPASTTPQELYGEYSVLSGATDDFLEIVLARLEARLAEPGFAAAFQSDFEAFLQTVDSDSATAGVQPYTDPQGNPILTLADTAFFGPPQTWPRELCNYPWIHFWHRLDTWLKARAGSSGMGPELLGDAEWAGLFAAGPLAENPGIRMWMKWELGRKVLRLAEDQTGAPRPANALGDVGAIEIP